MASITKDDELSSFDVPEIDRHSSGHTLYKIVLQVTPKELTENSYQVCFSNSPSISSDHSNHLCIYILRCFERVFLKYPEKFFVFCIACILETI